MEDDLKLKVVELEETNENLKDQIIALQKARIEELEAQLKKTPSPQEERDPGSNMIDNRPVVRTMTEARNILENLSAERAKKLKELENEQVV